VFAFRAGWDLEEFVKGQNARFAAFPAYSKSTSNRTGVWFVEAQQQNKIERISPWSRAHLSVLHEILEVQDDKHIPHLGL
jgi:hypothetical protein